MLSLLAVPCTARPLGQINNLYAAVVLFLSRADGGAQLRVSAAALIMTPAEGAVDEEEAEEALRGELQDFAFNDSGCSFK